MEGRAWWAAVHEVAKSWTRLSDFTFTFHFHALEKEMATRSSVLAWRIPGTREPGGLPSMGLHRVRHDWSDLAAAADKGLNWVSWGFFLFCFYFDGAIINAFLLKTGTKWCCPWYGVFAEGLRCTDKPCCLLVLHVLPSASWTSTVVCWAPLRVLGPDEPECSPGQGLSLLAELVSETMVIVFVI